MQRPFSFTLVTLLLCVARECALRADEHAKRDPIGRAQVPPAIDSDSAPDHGPRPFPDLLPAPGHAELPPQNVEYLPPLEEELAIHGGAYLYEPIDVIRERHEPQDGHSPPDYLPEDWQEPQPISCPFEFLGPHAIPVHPSLKWCGASGAMWEPRLVIYGVYETFAAAYEQNNIRRDGIGHQLLLDVDLELTGTERFHLQFRPFGEENTGGSFYQFSDPSGYIDNSTGVPQRWWFEGELQSIFGGLIDDPRIQLDANFVAGKFPFILHNALLMNDEIIGFVLAKNTFTSTPLSNINVQLFGALDDVDVDFGNTESAGIHFLGDYRHVLIEATYAHVFDSGGRNRTADYAALSVTKLFGPLTLAGRVMLKEGDQGGPGDGQLYVLESNYTRTPPHWLHDLAGIELTVSYLNVFKATSGWTPISGGNFNRLRTLFTLNPLLNVAAVGAPTDTAGAAAGIQLFCHHQDASLTPEIALEDVAGQTAWGVGLVGQRKLSARTFLEVRGLRTWSSAPVLQREGAFASIFVIF